MIALVYGLGMSQSRCWISLLNYYACYHLPWFVAFGEHRSRGGNRLLTAFIASRPISLSLWGSGIYDVDPIT